MLIIRQVIEAAILPEVRCINRVTGIDPPEWPDGSMPKVSPQRILRGTIDS